MHKVLIFENQIFDIENTFKFINLIKFDNKLDFTYYTTSQELKSFDELNNYDLIIIDIDLSRKSEKDGFGIIKSIEEYDDKILNKSFILTGSTKIEEKLKEYKLKQIPVLTKPVETEKLHVLMKNILS